MNVENLAIESQEAQPSLDSTAVPTPEITPLSPEFLMLVGGGGGVIND